MVDLFPFINHFPLWMSKWKRDAIAWHKRESAMFEGFNDDVEKKMVSVLQTAEEPILMDILRQAKGEVEHCFVTNLVEGEAKNELTKKEGAWLAGIMLYVPLFSRHICPLVLW